MRDPDALETWPEPGRALIDAASSFVYLEALIEHSPIAIAVLDGEHRFRLCNPAFQHLFQYRPEELASCALDSLIAAPDFLREASSMSRQVLAGEKVHTVTQRRRKDGMVIDVEIYGIPLLFDGQVEGVYALYQDVSERNNALTACREMARKLETIRQEEQRRFARDVHDSTSQELAVLGWNLNRLIQMAVGEREPMLELLQQTKLLAEQCSRRIRGATYLLHPPVLGEAGLPVAIGWMVDGFRQRTGLQVQVEIAAEVDRYPDGVEAAIFRVVQESLANVLRHSTSANVSIRLAQRGEHLELSVADTCLFAADIAARAPLREGVGLSGMRERIEAIGGHFTFVRHPSGTTVSVALPLRGEHHG